MRFCLLIIVFLLYATPVAALVIDQDTRWTGEQSFTENVRVLPGVTLTVAPGSIVRFSGTSLEVSVSKAPMPQRGSLIALSRGLLRAFSCRAVHRFWKS